MAAQENPSPSSRWSRRRLEVGVAVVLVLAVVVGLLVLRARRDGTVASLGGPSASVEGTGLQMTIQLPPGPYFLSELLEVQVTLANHSLTIYQVQGQLHPNGCAMAVWAAQSGGGPPTYQWPTQPIISCVPGMSTLAPGQTFTIQEFVPLSASGRVTLSAQATFYAASIDPQSHSTPELYPFTHGWPSLTIQVAPQVPADHTIVLAAATTRLTISAPAATRGHLYYIYIVRCGQPNEGTAEGTTNAYWQPITSTTLSEPSCNGTNEVWRYSVAAPGYAIASGALGGP